MIMDLIFKSHQSPYIGEQITQFEHMLISSLLADLDHQDPEVVLACFLHDLGHQLNNSSQMVMDGQILGLQDHENLGADYLLSLGLSPDICDLIRNHVHAKRYLITTNPDYKDNLSTASKMTLRLQGSEMNQSELENFRNHYNFNKYLLVRKYDDMSKNTTILNIKQLHQLLSLVRKLELILYENIVN